MLNVNLFTLGQSNRSTLSKLKITYDKKNLTFFQLLNILNQGHITLSNFFFKYYNIFGIIRPEEFLHF